jgi:pectate lyase
VLVLGNIRGVILFTNPSFLPFLRCACFCRCFRCRYGYFHIVNNYYSPWLMYAIGGSENPTINSEGNFFSAGTFKEVTKRIPDDGSNIDGWQGWNWRSSGDIFADGAFFTDSGSTGGGKFYAKATSFSARPAAMVAQMTNDAGPLML